MKVECGNCGWIGDESVCPPVSLRHDMGDTYSDLECPECGALVHEAVVLAKSTHINQVLGKVNWSLLAQQKVSLIEAITAPASITPAGAEHLQGLLHFIDSLQDAAEKDGFPVVFLEG